MLSDIKKAVIVSDLHIGLPYFRRERFVEFVKALDPEHALILNGDTIDDPYNKLKADDQEVVEFLRDESFRRDVYWIYGNHDGNFMMDDPGKIIFTKHLELDKRLLIAHGDDFEELMKRAMLLLRVFKLLHDIRLLFGAHPVHVAEFAKKQLPFLYGFLTRTLKKNAIKCALENNFQAIACGHIHYAEEDVIQGIRYFNCGTWTEKLLSYIEIDQDNILLKNYAD